MQNPGPMIPGAGIPGTGPANAETDAPFIPGAGGGSGDDSIVTKAGAPRSLEDIHIDELLHIVVDRNASDLHICAQSEPVIREDGALKRLNYEKFTPQNLQRMMYDIL